MNLHSPDPAYGSVKPKSFTTYGIQVRKPHQLIIVPLTLIGLQTLCCPYLLPKTILRCRVLGEDMEYSRYDSGRCILCIEDQRTNGYVR